MKLCTPSRQSSSPPGANQRGYVLITLILFVALLAIALTALAPVITQQIKRDREEELVHRGTQYSRAIKHYMKKLNKYPTSIEDLMTIADGGGIMPPKSTWFEPKLRDAMFSHLI